MKLQSNLWKLKILNALEEFLLVIPIITIFWLSKGLTMTEVFWLQSIFAVAVLFSEVPSGYFADTFGRKNSIIWGSILIFLGFLLYGFGETFWQFAAIEILLGIGFSFISGADSALLYDTLLELRREEEYQKIESTYFSISGYSISLAAILGGFFASQHMQELFFVQAGVLFFLIPFSCFLEEPHVHQKQVHEKKVAISTVLKLALHEHKEIKWLIFYAGFLGSSTLASVWFAQPFWEHVGVPITLFGVLWAVLSALRGVFTHFTSRFEKHIGKKNALISLIFFPFLGYLGLGIFQNFIWAIVFFLFFQFSFAISTPIIKTYINTLVASNIRATVLSVQSMIQRLIFAITGPFLGWSLDILSFREAFLISGFFFFVAGALCLLFLQKQKVFMK